MTEEELTELRAYKPAEVARLLNIPITRLETWVRKNRVPHQRAGVTRGVEFSAEDIRWIGRMRPELMVGHLGDGHTATSEGQRTAASAACPELTAETIDGWAHLTAHRPTPRASRPAR